MVEAQALNDKPPVFVECFALHRTGPLDTPILERCLEEIFRRHEIWRTSYEMKASESSSVSTRPSNLTNFPWKTFVRSRSLSAEQRPIDSLPNRHSRFSISKMGRLFALCSFDWGMLNSVSI